MLRLSMAVLTLLMCWTDSARARLDPESDQGYQLDVVLKVARHRLLTPVFQQQVQRELTDGLRAAFGRLATVKVMTKHPRLSDDLKALDSWKDLTGKKTHFILIDFQKGTYLIQARQHDGYTGQASPVIRKASTPDRLFVARLATLLINRDFGMVATLQTGAKPDQTLTISLKGAQLATDLGQWVKEGEVFRVVPIYRGRQRAWPIPHAVLQVTSGPNAKGECQCKFYHRYRDPFADAPGLLGYRCLKLGTIRASISLRFVQRGQKVDDLRPIEDAIVLRLKRDRDTKDFLPGATDAEGFYSSKEKGRRGVFNNLVHVEATRTGKLNAIIPIPIVSEEPVLLAVRMREKDQQSELERNVTRWRIRALDYERVLAQVFQDLAKLGADPTKIQAGVTRAKADLKRSQEALEKLKTLRAELNLLVQNLGQGSDTVNKALAEGDKSLTSLEKGHVDLQKFIDGQERILAAKDNPKVKEWLRKIEEAKQLERAAEFGKALKIYEAITAEEGFNDPSVVKRRDQIRKVWIINNDDVHRKARSFIYSRWPQLDSAEKMQQEMDQVKNALNVLQMKKDVLTTQKFVLIATDHLRKLTTQKEGLRADVNQDDFDLLKIMEKVLADLEKLLLQAKDILDA